MSATIPAKSDKSAWTLAKHLIIDVVRAFSIWSMGLLLLALMSYVPGEVGTMELTITVVGLAGLVDLLVRPKRSGFSEAALMAISAGFAFTLLMDLGWLVFGVVSGITNSAVVESSVSATLELALLIVLFGYLVGYLTESMYSYAGVPAAERGVLRAYRAYFLDADGEVRGWRNRCRLNIIQALSFIESRHIGPLVAPSLIAVVGVRSIASDAGFSDLVREATGTTYLGIGLWVFLTFLLYPFADHFGRIIGRVMGEFARIQRYVTAMIYPSMGYMLGYIAITLLFAGLFSFFNDSSWCRSACFVSTNGARVDPSDLVYLSITTMTTVGYGQAFVIPELPLAKGLVSLELVLGVSWTILVFAALVAYLTPRLGELVMKPSPSAAIQDLGLPEDPSDAETYALLREVAESVRQIQLLAGSRSQPTFEVCVGRVRLSVHRDNSRD